MRWTPGGRLHHPRARASTHRFWTLDELVPGSAKSLESSAEELTQNAGVGFSSPDVVQGPHGRCLRFNGTDQRLGGGADASTITALLDEWTIGCIFRVFDTDSTQVVFSYQDDGETAAENILARLDIVSGYPRILWENGAGSNKALLTTRSLLVPGKWYYLVARKSLNTAGSPNTYDVDVFIGGELVEGGTVDPASEKYNADFSDVDNADGGSTSEWHIGAVVGSASPESPLNGEVAGLYIWEGALPTLQIVADTRRVRAFDRFMTYDLRVDIEDAEGNMVDYTCAEGVDWVDSVSNSDAVDNATRTMTVQLLREQGNLSLATLKTDSKFNQIDKLGDPADIGNYDPAIKANRLINIYTARVPLGLSANDDEWEHEFAGRIDDDEWGSGETVTLSCRDRGGVLVDTIIRGDQQYSDENLSPVQVEMQNILDDNDNTAITYRYDPQSLYTPVDPMWDVTGWIQRKEPVLSALRTLAQQIGWECRYRYNQLPGEEGHRLTFYEPERDRVEPDLVLETDDILSYSEVKRSTKNVRNGVIIGYASAETSPPSPATALSAIPGTGTMSVIDNCWFNKDNFGNRVIGCVHIQDDASADEWGLRESVIVNAGSTQIDTVTEAVRMAVGFLKDLREPLLEVSLTIPLAPELELGDIIYIAPHPKLFTGRQLLAVKSISHTWGERAQTQLTLRGRPSIGFNRWLSLESRPGLGPPTITDPRETLNDQVSPHQIRSINHRSNFTDLDKGGKFLQIKNPSFVAFTNGLENTPDSWSMIAGSFGTDTGTNSIYPTDDSRTGSKGLVFRQGEGGELQSDFVPVDGDENVPYTFELIWKRTFFGSSSDSGVLAEVEWFDSDKISLGTTPTADTTFRNSSLANDTFFHSRAHGIHPEGSSAARWLKVKLSQVPDTGAGTDINVLVDAVAMYKNGRETLVTNSAIRTANAFQTWENADSLFTSLFGAYDYGNNWQVDGFAGNGNYFLAREDGIYQYNFSQAMSESDISDPGAGSVEYALRVVKNAAYDVNRANTGGTVIATSQLTFNPAIDPTSGLSNNSWVRTNVSGSVRLEEGDRLSFEYYLDDTAPGSRVPSDWGISGTGDTTFAVVKQQLAD